MHASQLYQNGTARYHGTVNHTVANDLTALQECLDELTRLGIAIISTHTGGARPLVRVPSCIPARRHLRGVLQARGTDTCGDYHRFVAPCCGCDVEWRVPA
ncbi:hypothetical protein [Methylogaea oryzae]|uniref:Uncharacterized protein n=1 Tax=Methylogaea oryzae TaxID=1295382 RepID=A0A8D4VND1_9GAMM|nr:hypothetical protein [Methylogaea oryzae]BBL69724.1 hypothetical protein MoryE10_03300 [Methylogaea oryzae]